jgi:hypothetical protein
MDDGLHDCDSFDDTKHQDDDFISKEILGFFNN